ncbi:hypothetical protein [Pelagibacterium halotolerans]|uniref:Uncharacterized protein n=1 Tax=Pelagibacterium halotolerans (strain DSM 22347 / JCM 15775 / CGMCC 1.7692 / B2) TaxID=1082931 RepID=G4RAJ2_PELHB|nr:hypothetical protein [Pelagibacterium halotolerans]AEQ51542.1 hypothetical protein KKY_1525 [Pelagibacterium halotolerans B2]QJR18624.1 hypothetical protein HKM20_09350 [Pelagibacterium halotolerans]SEA16433.1 hypothetical protein SAMN05428936_102161 [Pelagibacterium halotolerans]
MRAPIARGDAYQVSGAGHEVFRWLQAGLKSSAYRLAHLCLPKSVLLPGMAMVFFLA